MLLNSEGKGFLGCIAGIVLLAALIFIGIKLGPVYYTNMIFEDDIKTVTSQAGTRYMGDEQITTAIISYARKHNIDLTQKNAAKNVKIERYAGQVHITVRYYVPVNFLIFNKTMKFEIEQSSFTVV